VTGCAWTNAIVEISGSLDAYPTFPIVVRDLLIAIILTLLIVLTLALRGRPIAIGDDEKERRANIEIFFMMNALDFVAGWSWTVLLRDLVTLLSDASFWSGNEYQVFRRIVCVFIFGPVLTLLLAKAQHASFSSLLVDKQSALAPTEGPSPARDPEGDGRASGANDASSADSATCHGTEQSAEALSADGAPAASLLSATPPLAATNGSLRSTMRSDASGLLNGLRASLRSEQGLALPGANDPTDLGPRRGHAVDGGGELDAARSQVLRTFRQQLVRLRMQRERQREQLP
jgi:hypothetical protein